MSEENTTPTPPPTQPAGDATPPTGDASQAKPFASLDFKAKAELTLKKNQNINGKGMKAGEAENEARREMGVELLNDAEVKAMNEKAEKTGGLLDKLWVLLGFKKANDATPQTPTQEASQPQATPTQEAQPQPQATQPQEAEASPQPETKPEAETPPPATPAATQPETPKAEATPTPTPKVEATPTPTPPTPSQPQTSNSEEKTQTPPTTPAA